MNLRSGLPAFLIPVSCLVASAAIAQEVPEKALKYHEALLKRPHNAALFDRFFGAWIDEQSVESLEAFLNTRALANGGQEWTVLARYEMRRGRENEALEALAKGIAALPDDAALPMERAKLRLRRLEFDAARADLARVAAGKDELLALEAAKLTGKAWLREGRTEEAIKAWDAVLAAHPGDEDLLEDLVETAAAESETAQALVYVGKLIEVSRDPYQKTLRMLRRGDLLAQSGKNDEAVEAYAGTLNQVGEGSWLEREVLVQIEKVFRKQDRLEDLSAQLKKLVLVYPQRLLIHRQLAKLEAVQGETDAAIGRFREVLKRSPGDKELREEFVRLLVDGERLDDAVAELEKLIELSPADSALYLQVAALRARQEKPEQVLAALHKAHELLGRDEGNGIRIAGLMLQYQLKEPGEALLKEIGTAAAAGPAGMEALAAHYGRTARKAEAVELLKKAGAGDDLDVLIRTCGAISVLGESATAFDTLTARAERFSAEPRFLAALAQAALAAGKPADAVPQVLKLVRLAKQSGELAESIGLASRMITGAGKAEELRTSLASQTARTVGEKCLLAALIESSGDFAAVAKLLEADTDPLVIRFHADLLNRRGEFTAAIAVLTRLADTEEGRKAAYFKDLSELQQRAGKIPDALATVERWKLAAPGDKTAWITGSRLLRESGKPDQAVKMTRQAVARFEGDADLAASLASLHSEAAQWSEAEAIYWKLYDEGQSPTEQARWAVQLAQLAQRTGKIAELEEKLRERARGNRRSIGPILALAELARLTNSEDKRRELLLEAVRLQPKDIDLRLQLSVLEEASGNPDQVIAILEEALHHDVGGRIRSALAQAYLRQGQAVKGMRELRALSGKAGFDARSAESAAASLAGTQLYDEAIGFLQSELPDGGDWRSRYLLAVLLEEDGREAEALPLFLSLLQAQGDIPGLVTQVPPVRSYYEGYSEQVKRLLLWINANQLAYAHRGRHSGSYSMGQGSSLSGRFQLPNNPETVRQFALMHLLSLSKNNNGDVDGKIRRQIVVAGIGNLAFINDLTKTRSGEQPDVAKLLESYPDEPGLFDLMMMFGGRSSREIDKNLIRRVLAHEEKLSPASRFTAWSILAHGAGPDDPAWTSLITAAKSCAGKGPAAYPLMSGQLMALLRGQYGELPEIHRPAVKRMLLDELAANIQAHPEYARSTYALSVLALAGTPEAWLKEVNATVRETRRQMANAPQQRRTRIGQILGAASISRRGYNPWESMDGFFIQPTLETLELYSIPKDLLYQVSGGRPDQGGPKPVIPLEELVKRSDQFESPLLRAWLAVCLGQKAAIAKAMAVVPPPEEAVDFELLRAAISLQEKKPLEAMASLVKARASAGSERELISSVNFQLIAVAGILTPAERTSVAGEIEAAFVQCQKDIGKQGAPGLAAQARKLGLEELAKRIDPPPAPVAARAGTAATGPAPIAAAPVRRSPTSSRQQAGSPDKIRKFVAGKKYEAAAREILQGIRGQDPSQVAYYLRNSLPEVLPLLGKEGQAELVKLVDPGDSKSLLKRLEYVEICKAIGSPEPAVAMLEVLMKERPDDAKIAARLAFLIPAEQTDRRLELMTRACRADEFVTEISLLASGFNRRNGNQESLEFFETVTRWLESTEPESLVGANLTWVPHYAMTFFSGQFTSGLPSLLGEPSAPDADKVAQVEQHLAICRRLALAMLRHPLCAEEGFRLLGAVKKWKNDPAQMDDWARLALSATTKLEAGDFSRQRAQSQFFSLVQPNGGDSGSNGELEEFSSASWLVKRMKDGKDPAEIFPPGFIGSLRERTPEVGELIATLSREMKNEDLAVLWKSDMAKPGRNRSERMLRPLILQQVATTPGAAKFFVDQIARIEPGTIVNPNGSEDFSVKQSLCSVAITAAAAGKPGEMEAVARAISRAVFGEKPDFSDPKNQNPDYQRVNFIGGLYQVVRLDPLAMVRFQAAFLRLGVPVGSSESSATRPFQRLKFDKVEDAEAFFDSLGWLTDADHWEPYASLIYQRKSAGNTVTASLLPKLVLENAVQNIRHDNYERSDLVKRLAERKTGRFGSLLIAAALSSGMERSALAAQAFSESSADLGKLSQERVDRLSLVLPWLTDAVRAGLPEKFQRKLREEQAVKRAEVIAAADQYLSTLNGPRADQVISNMNPIVTALIPHDIDKAVAVFVAADQAFTASLARGGKFSTSSSGGYQISQRDYEFHQIMLGSSDARGPFASDPALKLRFLARILASPSGRRLVFSYHEDSLRSVFSSAVLPLVKGGKTGAKEVEYSIRLARAFKTLEPGLRSTALPCFVLTEFQMQRLNDAAQRKEWLPQITAVAAEDAQLGRLMTARLAVQLWRGYTPEEKSEARPVLTGLIADDSVPDALRLAMALEFLTRMPKDELLDPEFRTELVRLYQTYCGGERSAVSPVSERLFKVLSGSSAVDDAAAATHAALVRSFWDNATSDRAAGHSPIPGSLSQALFINALLGKDMDLVGKIFPRVKAGMVGQLIPMISMMRFGQYDFARQLAPLPDEAFLTEQHQLRYTRPLEESLAAFKQTGADKATVRKLEIALLDFPLGEGNEAPAEAMDARLARLIDDFAAAPPEGAIFPMELQSLLARSPENSKLLSLLDAWARAHPSAGFLAGETESKAAVNLHGMAAMHALARGDTSLLKAITEAINPAGDNSAVKQNLIGIVRQMARPIWLDACAGSMAGYKAGLPVWNDFVVKFAEHLENYDVSEVTNVLTISQFLAGWSGEPAAYDRMYGRLPEKVVGYDKHDPREGGFGHFMGLLRNNSEIKKMPENASARIFIEKALCQPGFGASYSKNTGCLIVLDQIGFRAVLAEIAASPPAGVIPEALPGLYQLQAMALRRKNPEESMAMLKKGLEICPPGADWNALRGSLKLDLANQLISAGRTEEARGVFSSIVPGDLSERTISRHKALAVKLAAIPEP